MTASYHTREDEVIKNAAGRHVSEREQRPERRILEKVGAPRQNRSHTISLLEGMA